MPEVRQAPEGRASWAAASGNVRVDASRSRNLTDERYIPGGEALLDCY
ncbi:hypothetical protein QP175_08625 [Sphingomonas aerolata]|uniref:Uncharacterized protein n=1 Tax=Sphingomonas aerolata TaxID=185951 RepID=A0A2T4YND2_9SPHN|nr:hypothetical protein [Sphingomonas aerolata]PTM44925.1 hypothetical protein C8J24_3141 [Sphingomonas aerolata]